jgi:hypothetical protein
MWLDRDKPYGCNNRLSSAWRDVYLRPSFESISSVTITARCPTLARFSLKALGMVSVSPHRCCLDVLSDILHPLPQPSRWYALMVSDLVACSLTHCYIVTGIGLFFSAFMIGITAIQARYTAFSPKNSEEFSSASRSVKPGLIASGIVSAWTWAATLVRESSQFVYRPVFISPHQLQSSAVAYKFGQCALLFILSPVCPHGSLSGISGPWWYGGEFGFIRDEKWPSLMTRVAGAAVQILLFAMVRLQSSNLCI